MLWVRRWAMTCRILLIGFGFSAIARSMSATSMRLPAFAREAIRSKPSLAANALAAGLTRRF